MDHRSARLARTLPASRRFSTRVRGSLLLLLVSSTAASVMLEPDARRYPSIAVLEVLVIVGFATAGQLLRNDPTQRANGRLLIITAVLQVITHLHLVPDSPLPMLAWLAGPLSALPAAVVLLRFPGSRLDPLARRWATFQGSWLISSRLTFTVPTPERRLGWWPAIPMSPEVAATASTVGNGVAILSTLFFAGLLVRRIRTSRGMARHEIVPVLVAAVSASATVSLHLATVANGRAGVNPWVLALEQVGLLTVPGAFVFSAVKMRMARAAIGDLLLQFDSSSGPAEIRSALAQTLSDPALQLHLWHVPDRRWTRADGQVQDPLPAAGQVEILIHTADQQLLAAIITDQSIQRHQSLLDAAISATRLALENAAALAEIRESRARIAEAGLLARKRLERDLHDGAQQHLLALSISLDLLRRRAGDDITRAMAEAAASQLRDTMKELRDLARGVHPPVLTQSGLEAAVVSAVERLRLRAAVDIPGRRWPETAETAAYFVIFEALTNVVKHAKSTQATVIVRDDGRVLQLEVSDNGVGGADPALGSGLLGLNDRVLALRGTVDIRSSESEGTCLIASIPYASP